MLFRSRSLAQLVYLTTDHAALGSGTGFSCHATWGFDPITVYAAAGSGPNFDPSTGHALGSSSSDPTTDHVALGSSTGSGCHTTSDFGTGSSLTIGNAALDSSPSSDPTSGHTASSSSPGSSPITSHATSHNNPTRHAASSKDPTAAFFNAAFFNTAPSSSNSDDEAQLTN